MRRKTIYWVPKLGVLALLSIIWMVCSGVIRVVWACGEPELSRSVFWFQIVLPLMANVIFVLTVLESHRDRLYRTAIAVWMGCIFFAEKALGFPSLIHTVRAWDCMLWWRCSIRLQ